jgi:hypothetical protein
MDLKTLERLVRAGTVTVEEVLAHAGVDRLDETVTMLKRHRAAKEVCAALMQRIAKAPLADFEALKDVYFRHCGGGPSA